MINLALMICAVDVTSWNLALMICAVDVTSWNLALTICAVDMTSCNASIMMVLAVGCCIYWSHFNLNIDIISFLAPNFVGMSCECDSQEFALFYFFHKDNKNNTFIGFVTENSLFWGITRGCSETPIYPLTQKKTHILTFLHI